ncbi:MAG TPA: aminotransferase class IV [Anaeromyxobacteraceae bacterium]|jgi:branched-chain amino acid aminotransferase
MPAIVNLDGRLVPPAAAAVSVFDRGFLAGDQVYEVVRTYRMRPFALDAHLARLRRSAARVDLGLPWDEARAAAEVDRTLEASRGGDPDDPLAAPWNRGQRLVRLVATRGAADAGVDLPEPGPRAIVIAQPLRGPPAAAYRDGVGCVLATPLPREDPSAKTGRHLAEAAAGRRARAAGAEEAILVDGGGRVTEGASSSVFRVRGGRVETPPLAAGILAGVTRGIVLDLARRAGLPPAEADLSPEDLRAADEIFITSTTREVLPVTRLDGAPVGAGRPGPVTLRLHALFREAAERTAG